MNKLLLIGVGLIIVVAAFVLLSGNKQKQPATNVSEQQVIPTKQEEVSTPSAVTMAETAVAITSSGFEPKTITVKVGTKVTWVNKSGSVVQVNSVVHPTHLLYPSLNLGAVGNGGSVSLVFDKPGSYSYHNHLNASQTGTVVVE